MLILASLAFVGFFVVPGIFLSIEAGRRNKSSSPRVTAKPKAAVRPRVAAKAAGRSRSEGILSRSAIPNRN
jgi:hypothetical protein